MRETGFTRKMIGGIAAGGGDVLLKVDTIPDEKLIGLFNATNDKSAFEEIVNRYEDKIHGLAFRITRDHHIAEAEKRYEGDISLENYAPYNERGFLSDKMVSKDWANRPDKALFNKEAMEEIEVAVGELPESYRVVFHLMDIEGLSSEETAKILGLSVSAVKSRLHRARLF